MKLWLFLITSLVFVFKSEAQFVITATGTSNAFGISYPANISSVIPGMGITFFSNQSINGAATLNMNGTGPRSIIKNGSAPLTSGDILTGQAVSVMFDGTNYQLLSPTANSIPSPNFWTVAGTNLQPLDYTLNVNIATTFGGYFVNGNRIVSSNSPNVVFLGNSGSALNAGSNNLFYGVLAGSNNTTGNSNIFMGFQSGASNVTGTQNVFLGEFSGLNATGTNNLFLGQNAGRNTTSAFNNIFLGQSAGQNNQTGGTNIAIGPFADLGAINFQNAIALGAFSTVRGSNMMALGGEGANAVKVGIGTGLPQNDLHVVGGARIANLSASGAVFANANGDLFVSTSSGASAWTVSGTNIFPQNLQANIGIGLGSISTPGLVAGASKYLTLAANQTNTFGYPSFEMLSVNTSTLNSPMSRMDFINVITPFATRSNHARIAALTGKSVLGNGQIGFYTSNGALNEVMRITENGGVAIGSTYTSLITPIAGLIVQGNVGIGSTTPGNNLDVVGGVRVSSLANAGPVFATAAGDLYVNSTTGISGAGTSGGVAFWNSTNILTSDGANFFWDNTNNRLGVGTVTPQVRFHVASDNTGNSINMILEASEASATKGPGISMLRAKGTLAAPTAVVANDFLGSIDANGRTASQYNMSSSISFEVDGAVAGTSVPGRILFYTTSSSGMSTVTERMRINSLGNIGVGITTPLARMHLKSSGTTTATSSFTIQNGVNTLLFDIKDNGMVGIATGTPVARLHVRGLGSTTATDAFIVENTSGNVVFDVQDDGSVGIGTGAPVSPLQVIGDSRFFGPKATPQFSVNVYTNSGSGPRIGFSDVTSSLNTYMEIGSYGGDNNIDNKTRDFRIYSNATSTAGFSMLASNGFVGIGTITPYSTLNVNGSLSLKGVTISAAYTVAADDYFILLGNGAVAAYTVTLPSATLFPGRVLVIKRFNNAYVQSIAPISGQTLYSMSSLYFNATPYPMNNSGNVYSSITLIALNGSWWMINQD